MYKNDFNYCALFIFFFVNQWDTLVSFRAIARLDYMEVKVKNTPEVTTALAIVSERLSNDKTFLHLPCGMKRLFFQMVGSSLLRYSSFSKDQEKEFADRFTKTIIIPWCYPEI